ncbi:choice-of-anchor M domain-containing protein [Streptomyces triticirhizae]|uniref:LPXTG cell wall anchor domain-containing protein n=1 Tax=Streptomyces triticirhizae TaxID=2483353 RepID=A0A3M2MCG9_9ACTN|nr:choice-of-anchor M domain-containing protein [Streptomyces triticirhizae]RMI46700.1 hypothetical protein EBN88_00230 [Streptomyces triticirhizae]
MSLWIGAMVAGGLLAAPPVSAEERADEGERDRVVLDGGHLDLAARLDEGELTFQVKDGTTPGEEVWREPNDVILHFDPRHAWEIPESGAGRIPEQVGRPGDTLWVDHSVTNGPDLLWPGWNTEEVPSGNVSTPITATFSDVARPDGFFLGQWRDDPELGNVVGIDIDGTQPEPGAVELRPGVHAHPLWFFTEEGVYRIRLEMSATLSTGERVADTGTLTAVVGDTDPDEVELPAPEEPGEPEEPEEPEEPGDADGGEAGGAGDSGGSAGTSAGEGAAGGPPADTSAGPSNVGDSGTGDSSGELAETGSDAVLLGGGALLLLTAGAGLVAVIRRRQRTRID